MDKEIIVSLGADISGVTSAMREAQGAVKSGTSGMVDGFSGATKGSQGFLGSIKNIAGGALVFSGIQKALGVVTSSFGALIGEMNQSSKAWSSFEGNMKILGKTDKDIQKVKKSLQDYATVTIYSASDMASTYSQLEATGVKGAESLVKGMAGLASASEDPKQAMKSLSQQMTQMAGRSTVAWQDFKIMLEQSPAGMSAVAKEMGMSMSELTASIQDGSVSTEDFMKAVDKVGNSKGFQDMATSYKTVDEALDGLTETLSNKLMPVFEKASEVIIKGIEKIIDWVDKIDLEPFFNSLSKLGEFGKPLENMSGLFEKVAFSVLGINPVLFSSATALGVLSDQISSISFESLLQGLEDTAKGISDIFTNGDTSFFDGIDFEAEGQLIMSGLIQGMRIGLEGLQGVLDLILPMISNAILVGIPTMIQSGMDMIAGFVSGLYNGFPMLLETVKGIFASIGDTIVELLPQIGEKLAEVFTNMRVKVAEMLPKILIMVGELLLAIVDLIIEYAPQLAESAREMIVNFAQGLSDNMPMIQEAVAEGVDLIKQWLANVDWAGVIQGIFMGIISIIGSAMGLVADLIGIALDGVISRVVAWGAEMWSNAKQAGSNFLEGVTSYLNQLPYKVGFAIGQAIGKAIQFASEFPDKARTAGSNFLTNISNFLQQLPGRIQQWLSNALARVVEWASNLGAKGREAGNNLMNNTVSSLQALPGKMATAGRQVVQGFWNGIQALGGWLKSKVTGFFNGIVDGVKSTLKIHSPSRVFKSLGKFTIQGFMGGVDLLSNKAGSQMNGFASDIVSQANSAVKGVKTSLTGMNGIQANTDLGINTGNVQSRITAQVNKDSLQPIVNVYVTEGDVLLDNEKVGKKVASVVKKENDKKQGMSNRSRGLKGNFGGAY